MPFARQLMMCASCAGTSDCKDIDDDDDDDGDDGDDDDESEGVVLILGEVRDNSGCATTITSKTDTTGTHHLSYTPVVPCAHRG